jgi:hypothetical protein
MIRVPFWGLLLIVLLAIPGETRIGKAHAGTSYDGAWRQFVEFLHRSLVGWTPVSWPGNDLQGLLIFH